MRINFRQGLVRFQTDVAGTPTFLKRTTAGVDLVVSPDPTLIAFADGPDDYLQEERQTITNAWTGLGLGIDHWLYVDIDTQTGLRSFGETQFEPVSGFNPPPNPPNGQHWFDRNDNVHKVRFGNRWVRVLRVFVAKLARGGVLQPYRVGSQVGLWVETRAGFILFDENDKAVQRQGSFRQQRFLTTESPLATQFTGSAEFKLEGLITTGQSVDNIPAWSAVCIKGPGRIGLASSQRPSQPAIGVVNEEVVPGEVARIVTDGFYTSSLLDFPDVESGKPLFVGPTGTLTDIPPQQFSIQEVGRVINRNTIYVDVRPLIRLLG